MKTVLSSKGIKKKEFKKVFEICQIMKKKKKNTEVYEMS